MKIVGNSSNWLYWPAKDRCKAAVVLLKSNIDNWQSTTNEQTASLMDFSTWLYTRITGNFSPCNAFLDIYCAKLICVTLHHVYLFFHWVFMKLCYLDLVIFKGTSKSAVAPGCWKVRQNMALVRSVKMSLCCPTGGCANTIPLGGADKLSHDLFLSQVLHTKCMWNIIPYLQCFISCLWILLPIGNSLMLSLHC